MFLFRLVGCLFACLLDVSFELIWCLVIALRMTCIFVFQSDVVDQLWGY